MSHFTTVQTKIKDLACIKLAIEDLGLTFVESEEPIEVRGYQKEAEKAHLVIRGSAHYDIGLQQTEQGYQLVADWWGIEIETGINEKKWVEDFNQRYAYHKVIKEIKEKGFTLEEEVEDKQEIRVTLRKWQ